MKRLFFVLIAVFICSVSFGQRYYNKTESDAKYIKIADADTAAYYTASETLDVVDSVKGVITALPFTVPVLSSAPTSGNVYIQSGSGKLYTKYSNTWRRSVLASDSITAPSTLLTGIYGYWKLNEVSGSILNSVSGGITGTNNGAVPNQAGASGTSYNFDTNTDYLAYTYGGTAPASEVRTMFFRVKFTTLPSTSGVDAYLFVEENDVFAAKTSVRVYTNNTIVVNTRSVEGTSVTNNSATGVISQTGVWYNIVVVTADVGQAPKIYVNGTLSSSGTPALFTGTVRPSNNVFSVGNYRGQSLATLGYIDEFGYWGRELTSTEISTNFGSGSVSTHPFTIW